jgi:hypothetical protein
MLRTICTLAIALSVAAVSLTAADPTLGTWKLNIAKSKFSPGPAPKSVTTTYSQDGEWIVIKTDGVSADGATITRSNRYKRDGAEYPFDGPSGMGKISIKKIDDYHAEAVTKLDGGGTVKTRSVISKDGKTRTLTSTGVNAKGQKVNTVAVYDRQ